MTRKLKLLIVASILFLLSIFSLNWRVMGTTTLIYVATIAWNVFSSFKASEMTLSDIDKHMSSDGEPEKIQSIKKVLISIAIPLMAVGVLVIIMDIIGMLFLF